MPVTVAKLASDRQRLLGSGQRLREAAQDTIGARHVVEGGPLAAPAAQLARQAQRLLIQLQGLAVLA